MNYNQFSELQQGETITLEQFYTIYKDSLSVTIKDDSVRGAATVYKNVVKVGDKVNNGTRFIEIVQ